MSFEFQEKVYASPLFNVLNDTHQEILDKFMNTSKAITITSIMFKYTFMQTQIFY